MASSFLNDILETASGLRAGFQEVLRCFSVATLPGNERPELVHGGKIVLPPSALQRLSSLHISYPMIFELTNMGNKLKTHAGVLEFTAQEGRVHIPLWMMQTLGIAEGQLIEIKNVELKLGSFVKIQPQSTDFLEISDPKAVLEQAFRNFTTLTIGDVISFQYNSKVYEIKVLETKPSSDGISIIETDLEVDFAAPVGYVEPTRPKAESASRNLKGNVNQLKDHLVADEIKPSPFSGSGRSLSSKVTARNHDQKENADDITKIPEALHLPFGKLFFGYAVVPLDSGPHSSQHGLEANSFKGSSHMLRSSKKRKGAKPSTSKAPPT